MWMIRVVAWLSFDSPRDQMEPRGLLCPERPFNYASTVWCWFYCIFSFVLLSLLTLRQVWTEIIPSNDSCSCLDLYPPPVLQHCCILSLDQVYLAWYLFGFFFVCTLLCAAPFSFLCYQHSSRYQCSLIRVFPVCVCFFPVLNERGWWHDGMYVCVLVCWKNLWHNCVHYGLVVSETCKHVSTSFQCWKKLWKRLKRLNLSVRKLLKIHTPGLICDIRVQSPLFLSIVSLPFIHFHVSLLLLIFSFFDLL